MLVCGAASPSVVEQRACGSSTTRIVIWSKKCCALHCSFAAGCVQASRMRPPGCFLVLLSVLAVQARRHHRRDQSDNRAMVETRMETERALQACRLHCEERIIFQELLDGCSIFTFGRFMGEQPRNATLNIRTNGTLLVELVGSALYFNTTDLFYDFLQRFINSTCPEGGKPKVSLNEICHLESDQPLCTVYKLSGSPPNNFFQPGNHTLTFKDFDPRFKWSFWSVHHIAPHPIWPAHVEVESVFYNIPEGPPKLVLYNAAFFAMWTVVVIFFVLFNGYVGNKMVDSGLRVRWLRSWIVRPARPGTTRIPPTRQSEAAVPLLNSVSSEGVLLLDLEDVQ